MGGRAGLRFNEGEILQFQMRGLIPIFTGLVLLAACNQQPEARMKVLIGATTVVAPGAQPIPDSIVVVAGSKIRSVGERKDIPVPQNSDRIDLSGKWIVPAQGARIGIEEPANLLVLRNAPNDAAPASPGDIEARLTAGEWQTTH